MARFSYGGQALIEGVLMRGRDAIAVALRHPDGRILWADERLGVGFRGTRWARLPLLRGLVVLYETLVVGTRWLLRAASVAAAEDGSPGVTATARPPEAPAVEGSEFARAATEAPAVVSPAGADAKPAGDNAELGKGAVALMLGITLVVGIGLFFLLPLAVATLVAGNQSALVMRVVESFVQIAIFIGYLLLIGRTPDVKRTFMYHGAEHMAIHALEAGDPLTVATVRPYPTAHPRCGTEFLVVVILVSIIVFGLVGKLDLPFMIISRIILIPVIAAISYELLRFSARHRRYRVVRWFSQPGIWVQMITTKRPTDDMIEVAIVSMEQAMIADGEPLPAGSGRIARAPLVLGNAPVQAATPEA